MAFNHEDAITACYASWGNSYHNDYYGPDAPYPPVHRDILLRLLQEHGARRILDAGCGSASFMRYLVGRQHQIFGFDITPEMVKEGKAVLQALGVDPARLWHGNVTDYSYFTMPGLDNAGHSHEADYDAVVCSGVMPHIPLQQENKVLKNLERCLKPGGLLLLEVRNELFSLFTQNRYTNAFFRQRLIQEESLLSRAGAVAPKLEQALDDFSKLIRTDLPPQRPGKAGSYDHILSRMHNPLELLPTLEKMGFTNLRPHFYHYHCLPPMLADTAPEFFKNQSLVMENPQDWRGYFMASALIISGIRT